MKQEANTVVMEMEGTKGEELRYLRNGQGKIMRLVYKVLRRLKEEGQKPENAQPIIIVVRKKGSSGKWCWWSPCSFGYTLTFVKFL